MSDYESRDFIEFGRHALGLPNDNKRSFRNYYVTEPSSDAGRLLTRSVAYGYTTERPYALATGMNVYRLTRAGAELCLLPGESLCPEDFPLDNRPAAPYHHQP